jgi:hypothetical protein
MKISAIEVESAVLEMPGVRQAALIAEPGYLYDCPRKKCNKATTTYSDLRYVST